MDIDNKREVMQEKANEPPFYLLQGDQLVLDDAFKKKVPGPATLWMRNTFADAMNHIELALLLKLAVGARQRAKTHILTSHPKDLGYPDCYAFETPTEPNVIEAWRVTEALLHQMAKEVHESGAEFRVMAVSSPQQVHPDVSEREEFRKVLGMPNLFYAGGAPREDRRQGGLRVPQPASADGGLRREEQGVPSMASRTPSRGAATGTRTATGSQASSSRRTTASASRRLRRPLRPAHPAPALPRRPRPQGEPLAVGPLSSRSTWSSEC